MKAPLPGQPVTVLVGTQAGTIAAEVSSAGAMDGSFGYYGQIRTDDLPPRLSSKIQKSTFASGRCKLEDEGVKWARGWDTEEALALKAAHALAKD